MRGSGPASNAATPLSLFRGVGVIDTGQLIAGHYRLVEHVGSGAMGVVWRAVDERLERVVAVKQILTQPGLSDQERDNVRQRAMREAKYAARLQHPNAIVVFDIAEHEGDPCLVMEYLPSKSLSGLLAERGTLPLPEVAAIGEQVAAALVAAHRAGIVHRDVKPGNILIDENGISKITDFGISRAAGDITLTQTGLIGGTPAYLAPELARGADPSPASDVFALGATLYHALEGQPAYGNTTNQLALLYTAANGQVIPPRHAGAATALIMSLLRSEPNERPTMSEARARLFAIATKEQGSPGTLVAPTRPVAAGSPNGNGSANGSSAASPPPWQRTGQVQQAPRGPQQPPPTRTTYQQPVQATRAEAPSAAPKRPLDPAKKRKLLLLGAVATVVVLVAAGLAILLNGGGNTPQAQAPTTSQQVPPPQTPQPPPPAQTPSSGRVTDWAAAGNKAGEFYSASASAAWDMLAPTTQRLFGSQAEFNTYWATQRAKSWSGASAYEGANNSDGSVDIQLSVVPQSGAAQQKRVRVIQAGGQLLIDSDPRL